MKLTLMCLEGGKRAYPPWLVFWSFGMMHEQQISLVGVLVNIKKHVTKVSIF